MVRLENSLTGQVWNLPDTVTANPFHLGAYPPGEYNIGTVSQMTVLYGSSYKVVIPANSVRNLNNNENIRSFIDIQPGNLVQRYKVN